MESLEKEVVEYDIRGQICPSSLLIALREINQRQQGIKNGKIEVVVLTDNRDATATIPDALKNMGYQVNVTKEDNYYIVRVNAG